MPIRVMYLDDEPVLCEIFSDHFSCPDVVIETFTDPTQAIAKANETKPDLLFVDFRLPGITGYQVAAAIREDVPIYLVTGDLYANPDKRFHGVFSKPFKIEEIQSVIDLHKKKSAA